MTKTISSSLSLICFLISITFISKAQTNVSGFISTNTTWSISGSPYIVTSNTLVSQGVTLVVDPGVVVKFDQNTALQIDGELIAVGTPQDRITFTSNQSSPAPGDWGKIQYTNISSPSIYDSNGNYLSGSILKYCDLTYGGNLGSGIIHVGNSSLYINNCKFLYSYKDGIFLDGSSLKLESSTISYSNNRAININGLSNAITLDNDTISHNLNGLHFVGGAINLLITRSYFASNNSLIDPISPGNISSFTNYVIKNNSFVNNSYGWVGGDTVQCNKFYGNSGNYAITGGEYVCDNIFENNSQPICIGAGKFMNNYIANNSSPSSICVFAFSTNDTVSDFFENNIIRNNTGTHTLNFGGTDVVIFKHNSIDNPQMQYEVYNGMAWGTGNVIADSNFWGGHSAHYLDSMTYDYFDYANVGVVYYSNNLISDIKVDTTCAGIPLAINETELFEKSLKVYPNPSFGNINIQLEGAVTDVDVELSNLLGELIYKDKFNGNVHSIETTGLKSGIYLLSIKIKNASITKKIVILEN